MAVIRELKNWLNNKVIYPKTMTKAVYDENGQRLDNILDKIDPDRNLDFQSADVGDEDPSLLTVEKLTDGETQRSLWHKVSQMFTNIRYLIKILGNTDISSIGDGTTTGAISTLNSNLTNLGSYTCNVFWTSTIGLDLPTTANVKFEKLPYGNDLYKVSFDITIYEHGGSDSVQWLNIEVIRNMFKVLGYNNFSSPIISQYANLRYMPNADKYGDIYGYSPVVLFENNTIYLARRYTLDGAVGGWQTRLIPVGYWGFDFIFQGIK